MKNNWFSPHRFRKTVEPPTAKIGCVAMIILALFLFSLATVLLTQVWNQ
jgi:hypothetical protein